MILRRFSQTTNLFWNKKLKLNDFYWWEMRMLEAIKNHWQEYLMEAWGLCAFMVSACAFGVLLFYPNSPLISLNFTLRNVLMGAMMGATAIGIFLSPWGKRSGAHINP